ncbi:MAG: sulfurtransferase TusA family protein [Thermodesulfobacteriota bacterium]|nr:sulfurtransferase TusA family protein [Thermodesulfobacteriota bacterium]
MEGTGADQHIDLRGVSCPLNYVRTKLKLEGMKEGQILEVWLDDGESILSVPRTVKEEGHKILEIRQVETYFRLLVRKKEC